MKPPKLSLRNPAPRRILLLRLGALGDLIFLLPSVELLRAAYPEAQIHWVVKRAFRELLEGHPAIDRVISVEPRLKELAALSSELRRGNYDLVLDYHGNLRSGLLAWRSGASDRVGFARPFNKECNSLFNHHRLSPPSLSSHKVERNLFLTRSLPGVETERVPAPRLAHDSAAEARISESYSGEGPLVVIHSGASAKGAIKRWFDDRFAKLADVLVNKTAARVVLLWGSDEERQGAAMIQHLCPAPTLLPEERLNLRELIAFLRQADLAIGADSGPLHMASALGTPVVGIYGPKSPSIYRPYFGTSRVLAKNEEAECPPCNATLCKNPHGRVCLELLSAEEVTNAAIAIIRDSAATRLAQ